tara:strand:+ start:133 stop:474 length:342 start_codon:yes stop_codon:yes gene_type:complete
MVCDKCKKAIDDCQRHCPHPEPQEKKADVSIRIGREKLTVRKYEDIVFDQGCSYGKFVLTAASLVYDKLATLENVVEIKDKVSGLRIVRDRKVDRLTILRQLNNAKRLKDKNR